MCEAVVLMLGHAHCALRTNPDTLASGTVRDGIYSSYFLVSTIIVGRSLIGSHTELGLVGWCCLEFF